MDDSPDLEGAAAVAEMADGRISYQAQSGPRGAAANIDRAFRTASFSGAPYAFVLEDDNAVDPDFISDNIQRLNLERCEILLRNQRIGLETGNMEYRITNLTTRGFVFADGRVNLLMLHAAIFFCEGISNGGLFWRTNMRSNLQVGRTVSSAAIQEHVRTLQIEMPIAFANEPLATFSYPLEGLSNREPLTNRVYNRARQVILRRLLRKHGAALIRAAQRMAHTDEMRQRLNAELADTIRFPYALMNLRQCAKGLAKICIVRDPLANYWLSTNRRGVDF